MFKIYQADQNIINYKKYNENVNSFNINDAFDINTTNKICIVFNSLFQLINLMIIPCYAINAKMNYILNDLYDIFKDPDYIDFGKPLHNLIKLTSIPFYIDQCMLWY